MTGSTPRDALLEDALADYMRQADAGAPPDPEAFVAQHPEIAAELRSYFQMAAKVQGDVGEIARPKAPTHSQSRQEVETITPRRAATEAEIPQTIGRYQIVRLLGQGAMGAVYLARDLRLGRDVALKTSSFDADSTGEMLERFYREARLAAKLHHPNICPVYDVDCIDGRHFISMGFVDGKPLSALIDPKKPFSERQALGLIRKLSLALQTAHNEGIIHRDLKPGNVMIDSKGEPVITDFGLARVAEQKEQSRLTQSGMIVGSPAYMSPEQVEGESDKLTAATDQYSLGVILYELLSGDIPFNGSITNIIAAIMTREPAPLSERRPGLDPRVDALCRKMMAKSPGHRFASLKLVADEAATILKTPRNDSSTAQASAPASAGRQTQESSTSARNAEAGRSVGPNPAALVQSAKKCLAQHQFEQAAQMLERVPEAQRTAEIQALLKQARSLAAQVAFLVAEIDEASRRRDVAAALSKAEELERIHPTHPRVAAARQSFRAPSVVRGKRTVRGKSAGEVWWKRPATLWGATGGLLLLGVVVMLFRSGDAVVRVTIHDDSIRVSLQGRTINVENSAQPVKVKPGAGTLTIQYGDLTIETPSFTLKKGENPAVSVELVDGKVAAKFGETPLGEWALPPNPPPDRVVANAPSPSPSEILLSPDWEWTEPENLGPGVNTGDTEVSPTLTDDETLLLFVRAGDVYQSRRNSRDEPFPQAERVPPPISRPNSQQSAVSLSGDGLLLAVASNRGGTTDQDIYLAERASLAEPFGTPRMLAVPVNGGGGDFLPFLSADGLALITSTERKGGSGLADLHRFTRKSRADAFSNIENLGPVVNTPKGDFGGGMSADGLVLFRTTFKAKPTKFKDDEALVDAVMCVRRSIGEPFSSTVDFGPVFKEFPPVGAVVSRDSRRIYFSSRRPGGQGKADLWMARRAPKKGEAPNDASAIDGKGDFALEFDGKSSMVEVPGSGWDGLTEMTMEAWCLKESKKNSGAVLMAAQGGGAMCQLNAFGGAEDDQQPGWHGLIQDGAGKVYALTTTAIDPSAMDRPMHVACVVTMNSLRLYVNGKMRMERPHSRQWAKKTGPSGISIGGQLDLSTNARLFLFEGELDEFRLSETARYVADFEPPRRFVSDDKTLALYHFDEGQGDVAKDSSRHQRHGRIINPRWVRRSDAAATQQTPPAPRLEPLSEINSPVNDASAWISPDGLRIYWEHANKEGDFYDTYDIYQAERPDASEPFGKGRRLARGRQPTLTPDELQMIYVSAEPKAPKRLIGSSRAHISEAFGPDSYLSDIDFYKGCNNPSISADGLTLTFNGKLGDDIFSNVYLVSRRKDLEDEWPKAEVMEIAWDAKTQKAPLTWLTYAPDELSFLATHELDVGMFRVLKFTRSSKTEPFTKYEYLKLPGINPVYGRTPRYCPATRELFLTAPADYAQASTLEGWQSAHRPNLFVIRNVEPSAVGYPPAPPAASGKAGARAALPEARPGAALRWLGATIHDPAAFDAVSPLTNLLFVESWTVTGDAMAEAARKAGKPLIVSFHRKDFGTIQPKLDEFVARHRDVVAGVCFVAPYFQKEHVAPERLGEFGRQLKAKFPGLTFWVSYIEMPMGWKEPLPPVPPEVDALDVSIWFDMSPAQVEAKTKQHLKGWIDRAQGRPLALRWMTKPTPTWKNGNSPLKTQPGTIQKCVEICEQNRLAGFLVDPWGARKDQYEMPAFETDSTALEEFRQASQRVLNPSSAAVSVVSPLTPFAAIPPEFVFATAVSSDGKLVAGGNAKLTRIWNADGTALTDLKLESALTPRTLAFSPDGQLLAWGGWGNQEIRLYDVKTGEKVRTFEGNTGFVTSLCFSADGKRVLSGSQGRKLGQGYQFSFGPNSGVWDVRTGRPLKKYGGHGVSVGGWWLADGRRAVSRNGSEAFGDETGSLVRLWDTETGKEEKVFGTDLSGVRAVALSPHQRYVAASLKNNVVLVWEIDSGKLIQRFEPAGHAAFTPDGERLIGSSAQGASLRLWDLGTGGELMRVEEKLPDGVGMVHVFPTGDRALVSTYQSGHVFSVSFVRK